LELFDQLFLGFFGGMHVPIISLSEVEGDVTTVPRLLVELIPFWPL
jgi:hypothetical protein